MNRYLNTHLNTLAATLLLSALLTFNTALASVVTAPSEPQVDWCDQPPVDGFSTHNSLADQRNQFSPISQLPFKPRYLQIRADIDQPFNQRWQHRLPLTKTQSLTNAPTRSLEQHCLLQPEQGKQAATVKTTGRSWVF
ncbi:MAG: hypothetical protein V7707_00690 [Motiliproteus sp.]